MTTTKELGGKPPVYLAEPGKSHFFSKRKIGIGIVPNGACTNACIFCGPEERAIQQTYPETPIITLRKFPIADYLTEVKSIIKREVIDPPDEIVITGIIGEPLLFYKDLLELIKGLKIISTLPIRLNTNGQATLITRKPAETIVKELKEAGLNTLAISLNAINENDYNIICQPKFKEGAFQSVFDFIKASVGKIHTELTFVDYTDHKPKWPFLNKEKICQYAKDNFQLLEENIIFRPFMTGQ